MTEWKDSYSDDIDHSEVFGRNEGISGCTNCGFTQNHIGPLPADHNCRGAVTPYASVQTTEKMSIVVPVVKSRVVKTVLITWRQIFILFFVLSNAVFWVFDWIGLFS